jgi:hypothetical protein
MSNYYIPLILVSYVVAVTGSFMALVGSSVTR